MATGELINGALQRWQIVSRWTTWRSRAISRRTPTPRTLHDGRVGYSKGNDHITDAVRCAILATKQANLDQIGEEAVSLTPVLTDQVFL